MSHPISRTTLIIQDEIKHVEVLAGVTLIIRVQARGGVGGCRRMGWKCSMCVCVCVCVCVAQVNHAGDQHRINMPPFHVELLTPQVVCGTILNYYTIPYHTIPYHTIPWRGFKHRSQVNFLRKTLSLVHKPWQSTIKGQTTKDNKQSKLTGGKEIVRSSSLKKML